MTKRSKLAIIIIIICAVAVIVAVAAFVIFTDRPREYADYINIAQEYLDNGDYDKAIECFKKALELDNIEEDAYIGLSDAYDRIGLNALAKMTLINGVKLTGNINLADCILTKYGDDTYVKQIRGALETLPEEETASETTAETTAPATIETTTQPQTTVPVTTRPQTSEPATTQPETSESATTQPETSEPATTEEHTDSSEVFSMFDGRLLETHFAIGYSTFRIYSDGRFEYYSGGRGHYTHFESQAYGMLTNLTEIGTNVYRAVVSGAYGSTDSGYTDPENEANSYEEHSDESPVKDGEEVILFIPGAQIPDEYLHFSEISGHIGQDGLFNIYGIYYNLYAYVEQ